MDFVSRGSVNAGILCLVWYESLPKQLHDRFPCRQRLGNAAGILWIVDRDVESVVDGCGKFFGTYRIVRGILPVFIGLAIHTSALDASSGDD